MRELKIFAVVVIFTALVYWGVEPYAHSVMNPHVAPANFDFATEDVDYAKSMVEQRQKELSLAQSELQNAQSSGDAELISAAEKKAKGANTALENAQKALSTSEWLWNRVGKINLSSGNAERGAEFFQTNCATCHGLKTAGLEGNIPDSSIYGVLPPDLSSTATLYDEKFLAALIMYPSLALKVDHKFGDAFIMTAYNGETSGEPDMTVTKLFATKSFPTKNML